MRLLLVEDHQLFSGGLRFLLAEIDATITYTTASTLALALQAQEQQLKYMAAIINLLITLLPVFALVLTFAPVQMIKALSHLCISITSKIKWLT